MPDTKQRTTPREALDRAFARVVRRTRRRHQRRQSARVTYAQLEVGDYLIVAEAGNDALGRKTSKGILWLLDSTGHSGSGYITPASECNTGDAIYVRVV